MLGADMPGPGPTHGEPAQGDVVTAATILPEGMLHGLQDVHLAGELVRITESAVDIKGDRLRRGDQGLWLTHLRDEEHQLGQDVAPAM